MDVGMDGHAEKKMDENILLDIRIGRGILSRLGC